MSSSTVPNLSASPRIIPFVLADGLFLGLAALVIYRTPAPMEIWQVAFCTGCVALAGWFGCWPFLIDQRTALKLAEQQGLSDTLQQIQQLELIARQIQMATGQWQTVQEHATKVSKSAQEIGDRMTAEAKAFTEFMQRSQDTERNHLRLEVEKLRRGEGDWLQVIVRLLDHVFALYVAAERSGQTRLIEQITSFQFACRDVVRRVGLVPFLAVSGEPFDAKVHQSVDEKVSPTPGVPVGDTVGCGYTFQGRMLRPALVTLQAPVPEPTLTTNEAPAASTEPAASPLNGPESRSPDIQE